MKKYFLTTVLMTMFVAPAFGADGKITGGAGTCTVDVLGVYDNNATANTIATWALNDYKCGAGQYLVVNGENIVCEPCPTGSYCPGGKYTIESENKGTNACPTGYTQSNAGASANTECYTNCTVANANIAHATAVSGNDYYGTGTDTCGATACETGYHVDGGGLELVEKTPLAPISLTDEGAGYRFVRADGVSYSDDTVDAIPADSVTAPNTWATAYSEGVVYGKASCQPKGNEAYMYILSNANAVMGGSMSIEEFRTGLEPLLGTSKTEYIINVGIGMMDGSKTEEDFYKAVFVVAGSEPDANYSTDSSGQYCYCQMDGFMPNGGTKAIVTSAPWVFGADLVEDSVSFCAEGCAGFCASYLRDDGVTSLAFRSAVVGAFDAVEAGGMCKVTETDCPAGQYLAIVGDTMMCAPCPSGSYCPGGTYTIESENKGTNACPSGYSQSNTGASLNIQCYTACTLDTANIAHATAVSGNDYYGTGVDTCGATACETGYHVDGGGVSLVEKDPLVPISLTAEGAGTRFVRADGTRNSDGTVDAIPADSVTAPNTWATAFGDGVVYGKASCQPKADPAIEYIMMSFENIMSGSMTIEAFKTGLEPLAGAYKAEYAANMITDVMSGKKSESEMYKALEGVFMIEPNANYSTDSTGQYCYCQMDGFMPTGGTKQTVTSAPWVFNANDGSAGVCAFHCASDCAGDLRADIVITLAFRSAVVGALEAVESARICAANTINIDWNPDNGGDHTQNMCLYDGAITLPTPDPVKPGYVFSGWKLVE